MNIDNQLISIIDRLTNAVNVCYSVENASSEEREKNYELEYPFAAGYSCAAMNEAIDSLSQIVKDIRRDKNS